MRIGIDARKLGDFGIGRYLVGLLDALAQLEHDHALVAIVGPRHRDTGALPPSIRRVVSGAGKYTLREFVELSWIARREKLDLFHAPHYTLPVALPCPAVVTIHDLIHLRYPRAFGRLRVAGARLALAHAARAERVIAVSACTAQDLTARLGVPPSRIEVIPNGIERRLAMPPDQVSRRRIRDMVGFGGPYLLYVGDDKPHKNLRFLLRCLARLPEGIRLALAGPPVAGTAAREAAALGLGERVRFLGFVPEAWLPALYSEAAAFVMPSLYEGFGLPVLEAMAQGLPVLVADTPALVEVAGDAGLAADPRDEAAFAQALERLWDDASLRERLREAGLLRAASFSWTRAARATLAVYEAAAAGPA